MYYKVIKNKIRFYEVEVDKKIDKIKEKIIKKYGIKEHRNLISTSVFNPIEKNSLIVNFSYKHKWLFFSCEYDYDIIYYPEFIKELNVVIDKKDYKNLSFLRKYQLPSNVKKLPDGRLKNNIIKREYPYDKYIKEIKDCFKPTLVKEVYFTDEIDMLNKIMKEDPSIKNKKKIEFTKNLLEENVFVFNNINDEKSVFMEV